MANNESIAHALKLALGYRPAGDDPVWAAIGPLDDPATELVARLLALRAAARAPELDALEALQRSTLTQRMLQCRELDYATYERLFAELSALGVALIIGQAEYLPQHKRRFWELFNACALLLRDRSRPRLLEFGTSEFSRLYKRLFPSAELHLSDRPTQPGYIGFTETVARRISGCEAYFSLDLEVPTSICADAGPSPHGYDLILFAEVLEHLVVNPVELLRALLSLLKEDGFLYLTTPNLFRGENRRHWISFENPQQVFPAEDGNWDRHHHHRELGAPEILRFVKQAGGSVVAFYYSGCWDASPETPVDERSNLVFLICPRPEVDRRGAGGA